MRENKDEYISVIMPIIIITVACVAFLAPLVVYKLSTYFGHDSGPIGDTIAGATSPIIGLLSAILLYLSFKAQIDANSAIREEANFRYILGEFHEIKHKLEELEIPLRPVEKSLILPEFDLPKNNKGLKYLADEIYNYYNNNFRMTIGQDWNFNDALIKADYLLQNYNIFINEVRELKLSNNNRNIIESRIWLHYAENMQSHFHTIQEWKIEVINESDEEKHQRALVFWIFISDLAMKVESFQNSFNKH